jgi:rubrerythrin
MYPNYAKVARLENVPAAVRSFTYAQAVEGIHATLFAQAKANLDAMKAKTTDYYVCPVCGYTTPKLPGQTCPVCDTNTGMFVEVS